MNTKVPRKIIYPLTIEELDKRQGRAVEIKIKDPQTLEKVLLAMLARIQNNMASTSVHSFFIDGRWLLPEDEYTIEIDGKKYKGGGKDHDARTYFLHPQMRLFEFLDAPVYLIDEVNSGQYNVHGSAMGWVGVLAVPS